MTMQVGMVGTDGIVLASDTLWHAPIEIRETFSSSKIKISHGRGLAVAYARNMETASTVADEIIADTRTVSCSVIEEIAEKVIDQCDVNRRDVQCLVVSMPNFKLFRLRKQPVGGLLRPSCQEIGDKAIAGDDQNPAKFWSERYYRRRPVNELVLLAAHLVTSAAKLNSGAIGGLEVVLCDSSGIHRLDDRSNRELESKANDLGEALHVSFTSYSQQFTYVPNVIG